MLFRSHRYSGRQKRCEQYITTAKLPTPALPGSGIGCSKHSCFDLSRRCPPAPLFLCPVLSIAGNAGLSRRKTTRSAKFRRLTVQGPAPAIRWQWGGEHDPPSPRQTAAGHSCPSPALAQTPVRPVCRCSGRTKVFHRSEEHNV